MEQSFNGTELAIDRSLGPHDFNDLVGFYHSDIWFVGNNGTTVQWNGTKLTSVSSGTTKDLYTIAGHQNYRMLAGGQNGILIRYDDTTGTRKWTSVVSSHHIRHSFHLGRRTASFLSMW